MKFTKGKKDLTSTVDKLEREKQTLREEVAKLTNENDGLNHSLKSLRSIKEARDKQAEIQKLLETNL